MSKSVQLIKDHDVKWIDLRFTDTKGTQHHVTMPARDALDENFFTDGKMFDGSSIAGWKGIEASDMILLPVKVFSFTANIADDDGNDDR